MATTIEELRAVMRMELKPFMRDVQQMQGISGKAARQVEQTWRATNRRLDGIGKNMAQSLVAPLTGVGAALGARELIRLTDTWTDLNGRVRIAAGGMREGAEVMERLSDMARRTYSSLEVTAESYLTNSQALKELGYSTNQQLDFTEALNNALVVSGAKGQRAEQVISALGKAMANGELRGDNLNTVIETGGRVAQALAEGLGVTTNELRKLGEQGKLKSADVFKALTSQMQRLRNEADSMQATIGDALQLLNNAFLEYVGGADQAAGASARIAEGIILVADNMDLVASAALVAAQAIIGALAGRAIIGAGVQILSTAKALAEFVRIARAAQGLGGLGPAFASLSANAGVIGLVVGGAAALALGHFAGQAVEAEQRTERFNAMLDRMGISAKEAAEQIDAAAEAQGRLATAEGLAAHQQDVEDATAKLAEYEWELEKVASQLRISAGEADAQTASMSKAIDEYQRGERSAKSLADELDSVASKFPDWAGDISMIKLWVAGINDARAALGLLGAEMQQLEMQPLPGPVNPRGSVGASRRALNEKYAAGSAYLTELDRLNGLTREQRDLEDEISRIRKDMPEGALASQEDIEARARANLAWREGNRKTGGSSSKVDPYGDATKSMQQRIDDLVRETAVLGSLNPLINDYGHAIEKARAQIELENAAKRAGLPLDAARRAEIERLSEAYAVATVEAARLAEAQAATVAQMEALRDASRQALETIIDGFLEGKDAGEIFSNVLKDIGKQLINMGMNSLFGGGAGGGFGLFGKLFGFSGGGYTGPGGVSQPAGVVHKGEVVWSQRDVARHGGPATVDAMRRGVRGFANGGVVAMPRLPSIPAPANASGPSSLSISVTVDGASGDQHIVDLVHQGVAAGLKQYDGQLKPRVQGIMAQTRLSGPMGLRR